MKKIINKVLEELKSDKPRLDYIRGLLEAISEEEPVTQAISGWSPPYVTTPTNILTPAIGIPLNSQNTNATTMETVPMEQVVAQEMEAVNKHISKNGLPNV